MKDDIKTTLRKVLVKHEELLRPGIELPGSNILLDSLTKAVLEILRRVSK